MKRFPSTEREIPCQKAGVPDILADAIAGYSWSRNLVGESGCQVFRLHGKPASPDLFLKFGAKNFASDVLAETLRLQWLRGRIPVPDILHHSFDGDDAWLLSSALKGRTAYDLLKDDAQTRNAIVDAVTAFLKRLHAIPVSDCPFNSQADMRLSQAHQRMIAGLVDTDDFDDARLGQTAEQLWAEMHSLLPLVPDAVVTHGDYSLDNLLVENGTVTGCIDVGRTGVADRYQDLAIMWNCLSEFGTDLQQHFLASYGLANVDWGKLEFHLLLDEFF